MKFSFAVRLDTKANILAKLKLVYVIDPENVLKITILLARGWTVVAQDITGFELAPPEEPNEDNQHTHH